MKGRIDEILDRAYADGSATCCLRISRTEVAYHIYTSSQISANIRHILLTKPSISAIFPPQRGYRSPFAQCLMYLGSIALTSEPEITELFASAFKQARLIYETRPTTTVVLQQISAEGMDVRNSALDYLAYMVSRIGTEEFVNPDIVGLLKGSPISPMQDWTLFLIADVLRECHATAKPEVGQPIQDPASRGNMLLKNLSHLYYVSDATGLDLRRVDERQWSQCIQELVHFHLLDQGALGEWDAELLEDGPTLVAWPRYAAEQELLTVRLPARIDLTVIDNTVVLTTEAEPFRLKCLWGITAELDKLQEKTTALLARQRAILASSS